MEMEQNTPAYSKSSVPTDTLKVGERQFELCDKCTNYHETSMSKRRELAQTRRQKVIASAALAPKKKLNIGKQINPLITLGNEGTIEKHSKKLSLTCLPEWSKLNPVGASTNTNTVFLSPAKTEKDIRNPEKQHKEDERANSKSDQRGRAMSQIHNIGKSSWQVEQRSTGFNLVQSKTIKLQPKTADKASSPEPSSKKLQVESAKMRKLKTDCEVP